MMNLIERLREEAQDDPDCLYWKAADEIERLRFDLQGIHSCHNDCTRDGCVNRRLREEVQRQKECIRALGEQNAALIWEKNKDTMDYAVAAGDNIIINELREEIARLKSQAWGY